jgi:amidase
MLLALRGRRVSAVELAEAHLRRAVDTRESVNALAWWDEARVTACAAAADARLGRGDDAPLLGLPVTVKESIDLAGSPLTLGEPGYAGRRSAADGALVARLHAAGAVVLGKTNLARLLVDWQTVNPVYGRTNNPLAPDRTAGGSSGGGAAVAAGVTPLDVGTDLIGSVRVPAAFCGVAGHRPSDGLLPGERPVPGRPGASMGVAGPIARDAGALQLAMTVLAGAHLPAPRARRLADFRVAVLMPPAWLPTAAAIVEAMEVLRAALSAAGARVSDAGPACGGDELADVAAAGISLVAEAVGAELRPAQRHLLAESARRRGERFDEDFARGLDASPAAHRLRLAARRWARALLRRLFADHDVLVAPITVTPAFPHLPGTSVWPSALRPAPALDVDGVALFYGLQCVYPALASVPGHGATALPVARTRDGLPLAVQVVGPYREDATPIEFSRLVSRDVGPAAA